MNSNPFIDAIAYAAEALYKGFLVFVGACLTVIVGLGVLVYKYWRKAQEASRRRAKVRAFRKKVEYLKRQRDEQHQHRNKE